jgi:hypothetical protein
MNHSWIRQQGWTSVIDVQKNRDVCADGSFPALFKTAVCYVLKKVPFVAPSGTLWSASSCIRFPL